MAQMASKLLEARKRQERVPLQVSKEPADTLIWTWSLQSCEMMNFFCFKAPSLLYWVGQDVPSVFFFFFPYSIMEKPKRTFSPTQFFVMADLENQYRVWEEGKPQVSPLPYWLRAPLWCLWEHTSWIPHCSECSLPEALIHHCTGLRPTLPRSSDWVQERSSGLFQAALTQGLLPSSP